MIDSSLFLGFPVDDSFSEALKQNKPEFLALFINSGEAYLDEVQFEGVRYLGKYVKNEESLKQLELLKTNIFSLLKRLVANYDYLNSNLILIALPKNNSVYSS